MSPPFRATITRGLIQIARGLGLSITAEGVETTTQLIWLRAEGVSNMQGYVFAKPMAAADFRDQLETGEPPWLDVIPE